MRKEKGNQSRINSGILGLDKPFGGGLLKGSLSLLAGYSGSGKTLFGLQFIKQGLEEGETCLYVSLKTDTRKVFKLYDILKTDWNEYIKRKKLIPLFLKLDKIHKLRTEIKKLSGKNKNIRLVIDDFPAVFDLGKNSALIKSIEDLLTVLSLSSITAVLTSSIYEEEKFHGLARSVLPPLVDNILRIKEIPGSVKSVKVIYIVKAAGVAYDGHPRKLEVRKNGLELLEHYKADLTVQEKQNKVAVFDFISFYDVVGADMEKALDAFNKSNRNIKVVPKPGHNKSVYTEECVRRQNSGLGLAVLSFSQAISLAKEGILLSLNDVVEKDKYPDVAIKACTVGGKLYGIPDDLSCNCLIYRKDLLEKYGFRPPLNWETLLTQAKYIIKQEEDANFSRIILPSSWKKMAEIFLELLWGRGGDVYDSAGNVAICDKKALGALIFLKKLVVESGVVPEDYSRRKRFEEFLNGKAVFLIANPLCFKGLIEKNILGTGKIGLAPLPGFGKTKPHKILKGSAYIIPGKAKYPEEALKFIEYLGSKTKEFELHGGFPFPAQKKVLYDAEVVKKHFFYKEAEKILENCRVPELEIENYDYVLMRLTSKIQQVLENEIKPEEALKILAEEIKSAKGRKMHVNIIKDVIRYLFINYGKRIKLLDIAKELGVSAYFLSRVFKDETGCNIFSYLTEIRIAKAKELMRGSKYNISEIGAKVGIPNASYFGKYFRRRELMSPGKYIKMSNK